MARNNSNVSAINPFLGALNVTPRFGLRFGQGGTTLPRIAHYTLEALLEPVQPEDDDGSVQGDRVRHHGEEVHDNLLERVELVNVHRVEASLGVGTASKEQSVDIRHIVVAGGIDEDRGNDCATDDPEICMSRLAECKDRHVVG